MAHFAELTEELAPGKWRVGRVLVVADADTARTEDPETGEAVLVEDEAVGAAYLEWLLGGRWVQTSYNASIRKNFAGVGFVFDEALDAFYPADPPAPGWVLNPDTAQWEEPA